MTSVWSCRQEDASGPPSEACPATHLALQQRQAVDLACDRSLTPRQRHRCLNSGVVLTASAGETLEWREGTGGRARQPRVQWRWRTPADEAGNVLRERHRLCQRGRRLGQLRPLVVSLLRRPC